MPNLTAWTRRMRLYPSRGAGEGWSAARGTHEVPQGAVIPAPLKLGESKSRSLPLAKRPAAIRAGRSRRFLHRGCCPRGT